MRKPQGYASIVDPNAPLVEMDTFTCYHCNKVIHIKPRENPEDVGGLCKICMGLICSTCVDNGVCDPFEKKLKRMDDRYNTLKSYGIL